MNKTSTKKKLIGSINKMKAGIDNNENFLTQPGDNVIDNILNYSKALSIRKSNSLSHFEMLLN